MGAWLGPWPSLGGPFGAPSVQSIRRGFARLYAMLRVAVIGTGFVGPFHVDAVRRGGYGEVTLIAGSDAGRAAERARALGVHRSTANVADVFGDPAIDVVHVCTPNVSHVDLTERALAAGKHVVVEKPVAMDLDGAHRSLRAARASGRHAMVAFTYRGYPMVRRARAIVAAGAGELGALRLARGQYIQDWLSDPGAYNWRVDPAIGGTSRAVADIGSHWFDTTEFVSGQRVEAVFADLATFIPIRRRSAGSGALAFGGSSADGEEVAIASEDAATILVRMIGGARGACVLSQVSTGWKNAFEVALDGERASLVWAQEDPERLWVRTKDAARTMQRAAGDTAGADAAGTGAVPGVPSLPAGHPEGYAEAFRDLFRPFYRAIVEGDPPRYAASDPGDEAPYPTLGDGLRAVAFVDAALRSSREGRWVDLPD